MRTNRTIAVAVALTPEEYHVLMHLVNTSEYKNVSAYLRALIIEANKNEKN